MLEPTAIHNYDPPVYRFLPPSPALGPPPSFPFSCVVLEGTGSMGGPSPALLHTLRKHGCHLVLATKEPGSEPPTRAASPVLTEVELSTPLHQAWYAAVFEKVLDVSDGPDTLDKYLASAGVLPCRTLCFCSTAEGAKLFHDADAGLIVAPTHCLVQEGADIAARTCPSARQLAWLHEMFTEKLWCACLWLTPPRGEVNSHSGDAPSAAERAELTAVASFMMSADGHPSWVTPSRSPCRARLGSEMVLCPDWTSMRPTIRGKELPHFPKLANYSHCLDVGVAQVSWTLEVEDVDGLRIRVYGRRFVNQARGDQGCSELSVTVVDCPSGPPPDIRVRTEITTGQLPKGFCIGHRQVQAMSLTAAYVDEGTGRTVQCQASHRLLKDEGKGDELVNPSFDDEDSSAAAFVESVGPSAVDMVFRRPRKGHRYAVEKTVHVSSSACGAVAACGSDASACSGAAAERGRVHAPSFILNPRRSPGRQDSGYHPRHRFHRAPSLAVQDTPPTIAESEEEHRFAWKQEWDKVDIEITGQRCAARCQRALRLFRFHQAACGDPVEDDDADVPHLVTSSFLAAFQAAPDVGTCRRPSELVKSRLVESPLVQAAPPMPDAGRQRRVVSIDPSIPADWERLRYNVALGGRWYRFTLTAGVIRILMQSPTLRPKDGSSPCQPQPQFTRPPILRIGGGTDEGAEVQPSPWREVSVRHSLTHLGRPDGTTGGFYGLMRRTRFLRLEIVRRVFSDDRGDYRDEDLTQPLRTAFLELQSVPRPPGWSKRDDEHRHILIADSATRAPVLLSYEKCELQRDIVFLDKGEEELLEVLRRDHGAKFPPGTLWVGGCEVPPWDVCIESALHVMRCATESDDEQFNGMFRNFITDRDGTTNNYCDRYASSVQSAYNAVWLAHFSRSCTDNAVVVTAAPLGGRPSAEGLLELSVTPPGTIVHTGSKGREYFDHSMQRVRESDELKAQARELIDELHRRLTALCTEPYNSKYLGLGSGLQRKFGEVTMARNDPAGTVPEPESRRFLAAVRQVKEELDSDGSLLDIHDTGTDIEIFARTTAGRGFDKGHGVGCLNRKLRLRVDEGPNLICGDTGSDVAMVETAIKLMSTPLRTPESPAGDIPVARSAELGSPRRRSARLAVLFVITPEQHRKTPQLASRVQTLCRDSGGHCCIVPSPDVLVAALGAHARTKTGRAATSLATNEPGSADASLPASPLTFR